VDFYRRLAGKGATRATALQGAKRAFLEDRRYRHPYDGSPFVLIGSWN